MANIKEFLPNKKNMIWWLGGGAAAIGFFVYKNHNAAAAAPVTTDTTGTDATASSDLGYDPSQYDLSSDQYGYSPAGAGGYYSPYGYGYSGDYSGTGTTVGIAPTTDEQWSVDAVTTAGNLGIDQTQAGLAVGKYLLRQTLTQDQANIITTLLAQLGNPPQSGAIPVKVTPSTGQTPSKPAPPKVANGYYRNELNGTIWLVSDETRHRITTQSWTKIKNTHIKVAEILPTSNVYKLPQGSDI